MTRNWTAAMHILILSCPTFGQATDRSAPAARAPTSQPAPTGQMASIALPDAAPSAPGFLYKTLQHQGETYAYSLFVPPEYTPERAWPVILSLHGSGERGSDGFLQTEVGIGTAIRRHASLFPTLVVMPQCRPGQTWIGPMGEIALRCVEQTSREYRLDPDRIYLTGLSLGGHGAWHLAAALPGRFAAVVPVCGFAELGKSTGVAEKLAANLKGQPIWCFHGARDQAVPVEKTRELVAAIKAAGGQVTYTEYADGAHNVWDRAYADRELWRWLFEQRRAPASQATQPAAPSAPPTAD
ncbi:MAG: PHB depolymerase family esterase [Planctomycetota bacterium]